MRLHVLCCLCILRPTVWAARFATEKQEWLAVCESSYKQFQGVQVTAPAEASFLPQPILTRSLSGRDLLRSQPVARVQDRILAKLMQDDEATSPDPDTAPCPKPNPNA